MSQNLNPIKEPSAGLFKNISEKFYKSHFAIEFLEAIFEHQKLTPGLAQSLYEMASMELIDQDEKAEVKLIELMQFLKRNLSLKDYCDFILTTQPELDDSFLHEIAFKKKKQLTEFFIDEITQMIELNLISHEQLSKLLDAHKTQSTAFILICRLGDDKIYQKFFNLLFNAKTNQLINKNILKALFTKTERLLFNPLHMLLNNASVNNIQHFLIIVVICCHYQVISELEYATLLSAPTKDGYTPLHDAIKTNNPLIIGNILNMNLRAVELNMSHPKRLETLLTGTCKGGFNALQKIYLTRNMESMDLFVKTIHQAISKGYISKDVLSKIFLNINHANFSCYFDAVKSGNIELVSNHIATVRLLLRNDMISIQEFKTQLLSPNKSGFNVLLTALKTKKPEILTLVLTDLEHVLSKKENQLMSMEVLVRFGEELSKEVFSKYPAMKQAFTTFLIVQDAYRAIHLMDKQNPRINFFEPCPARPASQALRPSSQF